MGVLFRVCLLVHDDGSGRYVQGERCGGRSRARISLKAGFMYLSGNRLGQKGLCESRKKFSHPSFLEGLLSTAPRATIQTSTQFPSPAREADADPRWAFCLKKKNKKTPENYGCNKMC